MKWVSVPDPKSGAGRQNSLVVPDSELNAGLKELSVMDGVYIM